MTDLTKLLPYSLQNDPFTVALTEAFEIQITQLYDEFRAISNLYLLKDAPSLLVDFLAFEKHVDFYEGLTLEEKKNVVRNALHVHRKKGTKFALLRVFELLNLQGRIEEWFEYGGDPYYFKARIDVSDKGVDDTTIKLLERLIKTYKNNRSWLEVLDIILTSKQNKVHIGTATLTGEEIVVYPYTVTNLSTNAKINVAAANTANVERLTLYPKGGN
ncbi:phage tail protein I [Lysinibacillus sphaericus]|uniref:phage tail protein I n=1 Tax=Lysinibacillus sphaericus TaxID=1421 RepID=UPI001A9E7556|nr:phage tail protein I [Lysinibacillus sphaericus]QTB26338.1 phage tail protein I [Lysinibacillus sphaericus]